MSLNGFGSMNAEMVNYTFIFQHLDTDEMAYWEREKALVKKFADKMLFSKTLSGGHAKMHSYFDGCVSSCPKTICVS